MNVRVKDMTTGERMAYEGHVLVIFPLVQPTTYEPVSVEPAGHRCSIAAVPDNKICWMQVGRCDWRPMLALGRM